MNAIVRYIRERKKWRDAGSPVRLAEHIKQLHQICSDCDNFNKDGGFAKGYDQCGLCKCNLHPENVDLNKLAWGTTECPAEPPLWTAEYPIPAPHAATDDPI